jgi:HK97 family phage portal protein
MFDRFKWIFGATERRSTSQFGSLQDPLTALLLGGHGPTMSGINISPQTALRCSVVFACVKILSETIAELPLKLYRKRPDGGRDLAEDHPLYWLLTDAPNAWTPISEFKLSMTATWCLNGKAFAFASRNRNLDIEEIIQIDDGNAVIDCDRMTGEPVFRVTDRSGTQREYTREAIIHVRGFGPSALVALSPIEYGREAIALALIMERHAAGLFGNGARPSGAFKHARTLSQPVVERLRAQLYERVGPHNPGGTLILEEGMSWEQFALNSTDAQFLELRKFAVQEVCRLWRIPLHMVGDLDRTTHSNAEELGQQFLSLCLLPILRLWQDAIKITCLTAEERKTLYPEFLVDDLARANLAARMTAFSQAIASGVLNPNEARALDNRAPYAGGEVFTRPVNSAPVDQREPANAGA